MKRTIIFSLCCLFIISCCTKKAKPVDPAPAEEYLPAEVPSVNINIDIATDEYFDKYDSFHEISYNEDNEWAQPVLIWADTEIKNFTFFAIDYEVTEDEPFFSTLGETPFVIADTLFSTDVLSPEKPFLVKISIPGIYPVCGISFLDEKNVTRYFAILDSYGEENAYPPYFFVEVMPVTSAVACSGLL